MILFKKNKQTCLPNGTSSRFSLFYLFYLLLLLDAGAYRASVFMRVQRAPFTAKVIKHAHNLSLGNISYRL